MVRGKKILTLTIDESILVKAKEVAELSGKSLSALVEDFLGTLVADSPPHRAVSLEGFYVKHAPSGSSEPSDEKVEALRTEITKKHS